MEKPKVASLGDIIEYASSIVTGDESSLDMSHGCTAQWTALGGSKLGTLLLIWLPADSELFEVSFLAPSNQSIPLLGSFLRFAGCLLLSQGNSPRAQGSLARVGALSKGLPEPQVAETSRLLNTQGQRQASECP